MASAGPDWETNPATQIKWGLGYIRDRYGSPCGALDFKAEPQLVLSRPVRPHNGVSLPRTRVPGLARS